MRTIARRHQADPNAPHVVICGAGFGGLSAISRLTRAGMRVTLVDGHLYSTFQPLLYQVATGGLNPGDVAYPAGGFARTKYSNPPATVGVYRKRISIGVPSSRMVISRVSSKRRGSQSSVIAKLHVARCFVSCKSFRDKRWSSFFCSVSSASA